MNITVDKQSCTATVKVEVPSEKVASERKEILAAFAKHSKIPGFRPGKAPLSLIAKRNEKQIAEELFGRLISEGCEAAIKQEDLKVLSVNVDKEPVINDADEVSFEATIILAPEFEVPEYKGLEIEAPSTEVTDEDVDAALEDLQARFAEFEDVDRPAEDGDFVVVDFTATLDGKPVAEAIGKPAGFLEGREDYWTRVEDEGFMPGFGSGLKGLKAGDKKELTLTLGDDFPLSDVRGAEIVFDVTVKQVKEQKLPELNDEFASQLVPDKSMEELKELIREKVAEEKEKIASDAKVNAVVELLNEAVDFELPEPLVEQEIQGNALSMVERARAQGMPDEMIQEQEAEIAEAAEKQARLNLKTNFILQAIAEKEDLKVEDNELLQRIYAMAQQAQKPVKKYIKELQKQNAIPNVRNSVLIGKTIDFVVDQAKVTETTTTESDAE